jgi:hypothetical protein
VSGTGAGADVGIVVNEGVGAGVYVAAGVFSAGAAGDLVVLVQPLMAVIMTTTATITRKTDEPFMIL